MEEIQPMKHLEIKDGQVSFQNSENEWKPLDQIENGDLLYLAERALDDSFEHEPIDLETIVNPAHKIIYRHLAAKLVELHDNRNQFSDDTNSLYKEAFEKYKQEEET